MKCMMCGATLRETGPNAWECDNCKPATVVMPDRKSFLGSSDIASVLNVDPRRSAVGLWMEKTGRADTEIDPKLEKFFRRRKRQEPVIAEMLADDYGVEVTRLSYGNPNRYTDHEHPFMAAEIDFEFLMGPAVRAKIPALELVPDGETVNGEIKTSAYFARDKFGEEGTDQVVAEYVAQTQYGMMVARRRWCLLVALIGVDELVPYPIARDDEVIGEMRQRAVSFWNDNVLADVPPPAVSIDDIGKLYSRVNGRRCEITAELVEKLDKFFELRQLLNDGEKEKKALEFAIADHVRRSWGWPGPSPADEPTDDAVLTLMGQPIATWRKQRGTYLDQKALAVQAPKIIEQYTREHWYRVLRRPAKGAK